MYSVTGETSISTPPTAPPAGREFICIHAATNSVSLWDYNNNNVITLICFVISVRVNVMRDPLVQYSQVLN